MKAIPFMYDEWQRYKFTADAITRLLQNADTPTLFSARHDHSNAQRHANYQCQTCHYWPISQAKTSDKLRKFRCGCCGLRKLAPTADKTIICTDCATQHDTCTTCGADINLDAQARYAAVVHFPSDYRPDGRETQTIFGKQIPKPEPIKVDVLAMQRKAANHAMVNAYLERHPEDFAALLDKARKEWRDLKKAF